MIILGIESSCDETGVGIIDLAADGTMTILADAVASSMDQHARFGGVVPEIASRAHLEAMQPVMHAALSEAGITAPDAVAATVGPGLAVPCWWVRPQPRLMPRLGVCHSMVSTTLVGMSRLRIWRVSLCRMLLRFWCLVATRSSWRLLRWGSLCGN